MENLLRVWQWSDEFEWRAGETFMSSPLAPLTGVVVYLTVIAVLRWLMSFRSKPIPGLRPFLVLHNLLLCLYSAMSVAVVVHEVWRYQSQGVPLFDLFCDQNNDYSRGRLYFMTYLFYLSKYYELLDTLFIVLKKGNLTLLHVYHHCIMMPVCWAGFYTATTYQWMGCLTNTFVHTIMYYYYCNVAMGYRSWWKQYVTQLQLFQFLANLMALFLWTYYELTLGCAGEWLSWGIVVFANITFFLLFLKLYSESYDRKPSQQQQQQQQQQKKRE